jgi:hypothetical protein
MAELVSNHVRRLRQAKAIDVNTASGVGIALRKVAFAYGCPDGLRIVVQNAFYEREIPDRGGHQDIGLRAAGEEEAHYVMPVGRFPVLVGSTSRCPV